ncbi:hypothetical protein [Kribbella sp. NBC_00889]|uniref:hypothetical protein n=1 Tax=Kribbella sp. NBC_00889 TaxID=2975974 RepID=UPI00386358BA|nr:hypothetical protein OG817_00290 [Kribbella sp. NBC_00889]
MPRAVAALTALFRHHSQLGLLYGVQLGLARSSKVPQITVVRRSETEHTTAIEGRLAVPTSPGEAVATATVCETPSETLAGLVIDHLVRDSQSPFVLEEQFHALYGEATTRGTCPPTAPTVHRTRVGGRTHPSRRRSRPLPALTYEGLIASPLPLVDGSAEPN